MNSQKQLWDKLSKENSRYYIYSDCGKSISEEQFKKSGEADYNRLIKNDDLINTFDSILDIGCGTGRLTASMGYYFDRVVGIDISGEMIKLAKERLYDFNNIELIETNGYTIPLPDKSISIAFSYLVFQHMKTEGMVESNFSEAYRVLKSGGLFKVRLRTDKVERMDKWWAGVSYTPKQAFNLAEFFNFEVIKSEAVKDYGLWLWLRKF